MITKCRLGNGRVILRTNGEKDATVHELSGISLKGEMSLTLRAALAKYDPVNPIVADDATPQRVVKIQYETFARHPTLRRDNTDEQFPVECSRLGPDLLLGLQPPANIEPCIDAIALLMLLDIK